MALRCVAVRADRNDEIAEMFFLLLRVVGISGATHHQLYKLIRYVLIMLMSAIPTSGAKWAGERSESRRGKYFI